MFEIGLLFVVVFTLSTLRQALRVCLVGVRQDRESYRRRSNRESDMRRSKETLLLLMSDSRSLTTSGYHQLAFRINRHFARRHGYEIQFVQTPCLGAAGAASDSGETSEASQAKLLLHDDDVSTSSSSTDNLEDKTRMEQVVGGGGAPGEVEDSKLCAACRHPTHGLRAAPWCKLLVLNATLHARPEVSHVFYLDSDVYVNKLTSPLDFVSLGKTGSLSLFYNYPYEKGSRFACSGLQLWRNGAQAKQMLQEWWDWGPRASGAGRNDANTNFRHDFEQAALVVGGPFWEKWYRWSGASPPEARRMDWRAGLDLLGVGAGMYGLEGWGRLRDVPGSSEEGGAGGRSEKRLRREKAAEPWAGITVWREKTAEPWGREQRFHHVWSPVGGLREALMMRVIEEHGIEEL